MNSKTETKKRKVKDPFFQLSENFFEKMEIIEIMSKYKYHGIGIFIKISLMLLKNDGLLKYDWKFISNTKSDKKIIEDIITESGMFYLNEDKTYFSSYIIDEQLEERGKISSEQSKRAKRGWEKRNIQDNKNTKSQGKLTQDEIDELNKLDGIPPKK
jgi:hypothetical protein